MSPGAYDEMAATQSQHWWFCARRAILREQIRALKLPAGARILEVGSGTGANLDLLSEFGHVVGLEMNTAAVAMARRACTLEDVELHVGRCPDDLDALAPGFDLICLMDVLEHIPQDCETLTRLRSLLRPGGTVLITVPAYPWMWGPHDVHLHHHRRYTPSSMASACGTAGLGVARITFFNTLLFPLALVSRALDRLRGSPGTATRTPGRLANAMMREVFAFERHLLRSVALPFGLSLLVLARPAAPH
jgi:SAM-dependent methyltransferase